MGLDITAYKQLSVVEDAPLNSEGEVVDWRFHWKPGLSMEWSETHFPGRGEGVDANTVYAFEDTYDFRAGSYSGYGMWRRALAEFARGNDFEELIEFSDCEGVIGPVVSKKTRTRLRTKPRTSERICDCRRRLLVQTLSRLENCF